MWMQLGVGLRIAFEDDARKRGVSIARMRFHFSEPAVAHFIRQPRNLEWAVAFDAASCIVVNRFAWALKKSSCDVLVRKNEL